MVQLEFALGDFDSSAIAAIEDGIIAEQNNIDNSKSDDVEDSD